MRYSAKLLLTGLSSVLSFAGFCRADDCTEGPIDTLKLWGKAGTGSKGFCHTPWKNGLVVNGVEVWANEWHVKGIQLTYSDGTKPPLQGTAEGDRHSSINWPANEPIKMMRLAGNYAANGLGLVHIEVAGKTLDVRSDTGSFNGDDVTISSGLFLGSSGEAAGFINAWIPLFMGGVSGNATIIDMKFDNSLDEMNQKQKGIQKVVLHEQFIQNTNPLNGEKQWWVFNGKMDLTWLSSSSTTKQHTFGVSEAIEVGGKVKIPFVAEKELKSTTTISYEYQTATEDNKGFSDVRSVGWGQGSTQTSDLVAPGHAKHCTATSYRGDYTGGYTSTVKITVAGKDFFFSQRGLFTSISWTKSLTACKDILIPDIPEGAEVKDAVPLSSAPVKRAMSFTA